MNNEKSKVLFKEAQSVMPGGVSSPVRSFNSVGGNPFVAARGEGAYLYDVDHNKYADLVCSWGPLIHGHNHPKILEAIHSTLEKGTSFGITSQPEIELCKKIVESVASVDLVRLVNSGTEACMSAIRLARGFTEREIILKFDGNYHGHADSFLVAAGSGLATMGISASSGVPAKSLLSTVVVPYNNEEALELAFKKYGDQIAGVIIEPVSGNMGCVPPLFTFLHKLSDLCTENKSVLIFDEVMTGFRLGLGGAQEMYSIKPDLTCFGKVIGAGLPLAAYGGRKDIMEKVAPLGPVYQAGTLSGNPLASSAGLASLNLITENSKGFYNRLDSIASQWRDKLRAHIEHKNYAASVEQVGSMLTVFFRSEVPTDFEQAKECDLEKFKTFFWALLERGVYYPPSQFEACFLSSAHDEAVMEKVADASLAALDKAFS